MVKKASDAAFEADSGAPPGGSGPVRRAQKAKSATRSGKRRRKQSSALDGIHQRGNKRMSW